MTTATPPSAPSPTAIPFTPKAVGPAPTTVARDTARGAVWLGISGIATQVLVLAANIVVARHLDQSDYGSAAMAATVVALGGVFIGLGFAPAIASGRLSEHLAIRSAHWVMVALGGMLALGAMAAAPAAARFFDNAEVRPLLLVAALTLIFSAWETVPTATLQRAGRFDQIAKIAVAGQVLATVMAVAMAVLGAGAWALVIPVQAGCVLRAGLQTALSPVRFAPRCRPRDVRPFLSEFAHLTGNSVTDYLFFNSDKIVVGRMLGTTALGNYNFANALVTRSLFTFCKTLAAPLLVSLGQLRADLERFDRAVVRASMAVARTAVPVAIGGALVAPELVTTLFGSKWDPAATLVRCFFLLGAVQAIGHLTGSVWLALGRAKMLFWYGLITNTLLAGVFVLGAFIGTPEAVAAGFAIYSAGVLMPACAWVTIRLCGLRLPGLAAGLGGIARDVLGMCLAVWAVRAGLYAGGAPHWMILAAAVAAGAMTYGLLFRILAVAEMDYLLAAMPKAVGRVGRRVFFLPERRDAGVPQS